MTIKLQIEQEANALAELLAEQKRVLKETNEKKEALEKAIEGLTNIHHVKQRELEGVESRINQADKALDKLLRKVSSEEELQKKIKYLSSRTSTLESEVKRLSGLKSELVKEFEALSLAKKRAKQWAALNGISLEDVKGVKLLLNHRNALMSEVTMLDTSIEQKKKKIKSLGREIEMYSLQKYRQEEGYE